MINRLKELRKEQGLSIRALADKVGYHFATISTIENGVRDTSAESLVALCDYFNVTTDYFLCRSNVRNSTEIMDGVDEHTLTMALKYQDLTKEQKMAIDVLISTYEGSNRNGNR